MKRKVLAAVAAAATSMVVLSACGSSGDSGGGTSCTNDIVNPDAKQVTVWAWYPSFEDVVDLFNNSHTDIQICWTNAGQGANEYTKFSTAIKAGTGAPDVIMLEAEQINSYALLDSLVDLTDYGADDVEADYTEGAWKDVSSGDAVYAIPVDGGPMGYLYRKDIFDEYGIDSAPATWDELAEDAEKIKAAGYDGQLIDFPANGGAYLQALFEQAGNIPFTYDLQDPTNVGIDLNSAAAKKVLSFWNDLVSNKLVATDDAFTTDYNTKLVNGTYASYAVAAWGPGYLSGLEGADEDAEWVAAALPQWDVDNPVYVNQGGSTFAVTSQAEDPAAAAEVAMGIFNTEDAWKIGIEEGALFPLWTPILESDYFTDLEYDFFGGQQINKDVFLEAAQGYGGVIYSPFQNYVYDTMTDTFAEMVQGKITSDEALDTVQDKVVQYAQEQSFTVSTDTGGE